MLSSDRRLRGSHDHSRRCSSQFFVARVVSNTLFYALRCRIDEQALTTHYEALCRRIVVRAFTYLCRPHTFPEDAFAHNHSGKRRYHDDVSFRIQSYRSVQSPRKSNPKLSTSLRAGYTPYRRTSGRGTTPTIGRVVNRFAIVLTQPVGLR